MRSIEITAVVEARTATEVFSLISEFEQYQNQCQAVRSVTFTERSERRAVSKWEVNFRQGIMRWTELDVFEAEKLAIHFEQIEGDAKSFVGSWLLADRGAGCEVRFVASFDMGVPSISDIIEPIAERALEENVESILKGLLAGQVEIISRSSALSRSS